MTRLRRGVTMLELLIVVGFIVVIAGVGTVMLRGRRSGVEFSGTVERMAALLRDAQARAVAQADGSSWGVRFENASTSPFYALFRSSYATSSVISRMPLPPSVQYASSSIAVGSAREVTFAQITGYPGAPAAVAIVSQTSSSTITVTSVGAISF